jgi:hypothetical protein
MLRSGRAPCAGELEVTIAVMLPHHRLLVLIEGIIGTAMSSSIVEPGRLDVVKRHHALSPVQAGLKATMVHGLWTEFVVFFHTKTIQILGKISPLF